MATTVGSLTRTAHRRDGQPLNVLCMPTHERYESGLARTGHNFYAVRAPGIKDWNRTYAPVPANYVLLNPSRAERQLPPDVDFDLVLSQNKFGQMQIARQFARQLQLPLVSLEHTLPPPAWGPGRLDALRQLRGHRNVFISAHSVGAWGWDPADPTVRVVRHGVDADTFSPNEMVADRRDHLLSVVNDWKNRDWCCGFALWQEATRGLPVAVVGDTPGLSAPAASVHDLVLHYRRARVFVNTSLVSPVPTALLEAMACGCAVVSTANCMIPEVVEHGVSGLLANDAAGIAGHCRTLLADAGLCKKLGEAARRTVLERFALGRFVADWDAVLREASEIVTNGETP